MMRFRYIAVVVLALSVMLAGLPVPAKAHCPMMAGMHDKGHDKRMAHPCPCCDKHNHGKNGCSDMGCVGQCSMSGGGALLPGIKITPIFFASRTGYALAPDNVLVSYFFLMQDRPPKSLS